MSLVRFFQTDLSRLRLFRFLGSISSTTCRALLDAGFILGVGSSSSSSTWVVTVLSGSELVSSISSVDKRSPSPYREDLFVVQESDPHFISKVSRISSQR
jgi:hypothetical protein